MRRKRREPCDFCDGTLKPGRVTVVRERGRRVVFIERVPALVCDRCRMRYYEAAVVRSMEKIARAHVPARRTIRVPVTRFVDVA